MPQIQINYTALEHNLKNIIHLSKEWNFQWLPVIKMVANYPPIIHLLQKHQYFQYGTADVYDYLCFGENLKPEQNIYINIAPQNYAEKVIQNFLRSAISTKESFIILNNTAKKLQKKHNVLLMLDLGDGREGIQLDKEFTELILFLKNTTLNHIQIVGVGVTLGCLNGLCPDNTIMENLAHILPTIQPILQTNTPIVSLGGSIFWNWFAQNHQYFHKIIPNNWKIELRMGDPLFLGYDIYREQEFLGAHFRKDTFEIKAQILEIHTKKNTITGTFVNNGHGETHTYHSPKTITQALVDCGLLHTNITNLKPILAGTKLINYSGNYTILDITNCNEPLKQGDFISFSPDYWAIAKAFRTPQTLKI